MTCIKEIAGHLVDVTELFCGRVRTILEGETPPSRDRIPPPWRLLEGKGYPAVAAPVITERFRLATEQALNLMRGLDVSAWGRYELLPRGRVTTVLDLGTWLANHNTTHLAQITAMQDRPL